LKLSQISRRTFLRGALRGAAVAIALPMLEMFVNGNGDALATGDVFPKRFGLFYWGNGVIPAKWIPSGSGSTWALSEQLGALADVKDQVSVVSGTAVKVPNVDPHMSGASGIMAGAPVLITNGDKTLPVASIDQVVAGAIGKTTPFRSLEFGAAPGRGLSYNGRDNRNPPETSPKALFDRLFGGGLQHVSGSGVDTSEAVLRQSVLDSVMQNAKRMRAVLGSNDRVRIYQPLAGIRELERRIGTTGMADFAACAVPASPLSDYPEIGGRPQLSAINRVMVDVAVMALACDQTRVVSNFFTYPGSDNIFPGSTTGHHQLTHDEPGDQPEVNDITKQIMAEYAYMVAQFQSIPEGSGTLLDRCVLLGTTEVSLGKTHNLEEMPILLAGSAGGRIKQGYHYRSESGENSSKVMLSILHALDVPAASFGIDEGLVNTGLRGIET
jgi:hypothetical protein